jgi:hypothetical protein
MEIRCSAKAAQIRHLAVLRAPKEGIYVWRPTRRIRDEAGIGPARNLSAVIVDLRSAVRTTERT